jgi:hypothetical protein
MDAWHMPFFAPQGMYRGWGASRTNTDRSAKIFEDD